MNLDTRTAAILAVSVSAVLSILQTVIWRTRQTYPGFGRWAIGNLALCGSLLHLCLRGQIPDALSTLGAAALAILSSVLVLEGIREFRGLQARSWLVLAGGLCTFAVFCIFKITVDAANVRIFALSSYLAVVSFMKTATLVRDMPKDRRQSMVFTGTVFASAAVGHLVQCAVALSPFAPRDILDASTSNALTFLFATLSITLWSIGFFMLTNERLVADLKRAQTETAAMNRELQRSDTAKSEFLANVSHEIRTPMNGVIGLTELLLETELSENQREYAETVRESGRALLTIINDILDLSKMEAGRLELVEASFSLREMVEGAAELLALRAEEKGLELICHIDSSVPSHVRGDAGRLRQILVNLGGNAIKFTANGEIGIFVSADQDAPESVTLRFEVSDTGIGIPVERQAELFQRFSQLHGGANRKFGGTGLGLAISKDLTRLMGGDMGLSSTEGSGSTFWFTAVLKKEPKVESAPSPLPARVLSVSPAGFRRRKLDGLFNGLKCPHKEVSTLEEAVAMLRASRDGGEAFDTVVIDCKNAVFAERALAEEEWRGAGVVLLMPLRNGTTPLPPGFNRVASITKPVRLTELLRAVRRVVATGPALPGASKVPAGSSLPAISCGLTALVVDDNLINQKLTAAFLQKAGCAVQAASSGQEALELLARHTIHLVFMDCQMPGMDGFDATRAIRRASSRTLDPHVPIIAVTANARPEDRNRCLAAGMDDYISKPVSAADIHQAVRRWGLGSPKAPAPVQPKPRTRIVSVV